jgi:hypothetical protein
MFYALLIYGSESDWRGMDRGQRARIMESHIKAVQMENDAGALLAGFRLFPTDRATTVRATPAGITTLDGPFAETKEQFGGFQLVSCKCLDDAIAYARQFVEHGGTVEVRPLNLDAISID